MNGTDATSRHVGASAWQAAGPGFEVYDNECEALLGGAARLALVTETDAHEGPVYVPGEDALYFTSLPRKVDIRATGTPGAYIKRLALDGLNFPVDPSRLSVVPARVNMPNGMALGRDGRLVVCEQGTRAKHARISRVDPTTGEAETVVDAWCGLRLNSPNDVAVKLQPIPNSRSHSSSHLRTQPLIPLPPEPSASGWVSSNALLPGRLVITGIARCSASARSSS